MILSGCSYHPAHLSPVHEIDPHLLFTVPITRKNRGGSTVTLVLGISCLLMSVGWLTSWHSSSAARKGAEKAEAEAASLRGQLAGLRVSLVEVTTSLTMRECNHPVCPVTRQVGPYCLHAALHTEFTEHQEGRL